jgi:hypothetical protein
MRSATQRKLEAALDPTPASPEILDALRALSTLGAPGSLVARRGLRSIAERQGLELNQRLLASFGQLQAQLEATERELDGLCEASGSAVARLQSTRAATEVLISQTSRLKEQVRQAAQRERLAVALTEALHLSAEHEAVLNTPRDAPLSLDALLEALARVRLAGSRGRKLLGGKFEQLGMQVSSQMSAYEERGYSAILRWLTAEAPRLPPNTPAQTLEPLRRGVASLAGQPAMLAICLHEIVAARREAHRRAFARSLSVPASGARGGAAVTAITALEGVLRDLASAVQAERRLLEGLFRPEHGAPDCSTEPAGHKTSPAEPLASLTEEPAAAADATVGDAGPQPRDARAIGRAVASSFELVAPLLSSHVQALLGASLPLPSRLRMVLVLRSAADAMATSFPDVATSAEGSEGGSTGEVGGSGKIRNEGESGVTAAGGGASGGDGASLASALASCASLASDRFHSTLQSQTTATLLTVTRVPLGLSVPRQLFEMSQLLDELLNACARVHAEAAAPEAGSAPGLISAASGTSGQRDGHGPLMTFVHSELLPSVHGEEERMVQAFIDKPLRHFASLASPSSAEGAGGALAPAGGRAATLRALLGGNGSDRGAGLGGGAEGGTAGGAYPAGGSGAGGTSLRPSDRAVFLLNCTAALRAVTSCHHTRAAADVTAALDAHADALLGTLVEAAAAAFFDECGLAPKLDALHTAAAQRQLTPASMIGLEPLAMGSAMRGFYAILFQRGSGDVLPAAQQISSPPLRQLATMRAARAIADTHRRVHALIAQPESGYPDNGRGILLHSPEEIDTLLDVSDV